MIATFGAVIGLEDLSKEPSNVSSFGLLGLKTKLKFLGNATLMVNHMIPELDSRPELYYRFKDAMSKDQKKLYKKLHRIDNICWRRYKNEVYYENYAFCTKYYLRKIREEKIKKLYELFTKLVETPNPSDDTVVMEHSSSDVFLIMNRTVDLRESTKYMMQVVENFRNFVFSPKRIFDFIDIMPRFYRIIYYKLVLVRTFCEDEYSFSTNISVEQCWDLYLKQITNEDEIESLYDWYNINNMFFTTAKAKTRSSADVLRDEDAVSKTP